MKTLKQKIEEHDNNYSHLEPFTKSPELKSSIIIPVYNQAKLFANTMKVLARQWELNGSPYNFEVIVINDGSQESIEPIIYQNPLPVETKYIRLDNNSGRSHARNIGIEEAENELLFFLDSDVLVPNYYFQAHWNIHYSAIQHQVHASVIGLAENVEPNDPRLKTIMNEYFAHPPNISKDFRVYDDGTDWYPSRRESRLLKESKNLKDFPVEGFTLPEMYVTHNVSVSKTLAVEVGGFEESFQGWGMEDTHFGAKLMATGAYIIPSMDDYGVFKIQHPSRDGKDIGEQCRDNLEIYRKLLEEYS
jgi:glycosyltransferase involved in cell wall biosynthesis